MELALLVYIVDLITGLDSFLTGLLKITVAFSGAGLFLGFLVSVMEKPYSLNQMFMFIKKYYPVKTLLAILFTVWIIPSQATMKYIAAGYLIQTTFESEFVKETVTLSQKAVIKQLQVWSEDNSDLQELIKSVDLPLSNNSTKKENNHD